MALIKEAKAFGRAQISAFVGGIVDYLIMLVCVEFLETHYVAGIVIGGIIGAVVNYSINRNWSFAGNKEGAQQQIGKFIIVVIGSILLKSAGTTLLTEVLHIDYKVSRLITDAVVSFGFNYVLQRYWVFRGQMGS